MKNQDNNLGTVLIYLQEIIENKKKINKSSYTSKLVKGNLNQIMQKVGEESIEVIIEATLKNKKIIIYGA